jgi:glycosyltransferase involved in cell wall biosynthesis
VLYTQEFLAERGVPLEVMHLYRNPVDHTKFHPVDAATRTATRTAFGFTDSDIVLTHHGILHPNKGNDWILRQLAETQVSSFKFLLIGNGPEMDNLKNLANELGIADRVVFTGWLPTEEDLNNALASTDIGLVMRIGQETDHFHMTDTLAHEMACGKPILAVNLHGIAEVIHDGQNGFLFSPDRPDEFMDKLHSLASDPVMRKNFSTHALSWSFENGSVNTSASDLTAFLAQTLKGF